MLFYPTRRGSAPVSSSRHSNPRPLSSGDGGDAMHLTWMLKSFVMGITLLGLSYWLVQIAGVQYLASLTSATLLAFLLAYVVWCLLHKNRHSQQRASTASRMEAGNTSPIDTLTPTPPPSFDRLQAYKFSTAVPPRNCSPPPSYEEAIRAMMGMATSTPSLPHHATASPMSEPGPQWQSPRLAPPIPVGLTPRVYSSITQSSPSSLAQSPPSAFMLSSQSALTPSSSSALTWSSPSALTPSPSSDLALTSQLQSALAPNPPSALKIQPESESVSSALTQPSQSVLTPSSPTALTETLQSALITPPSSAVSFTPSQHPTRPAFDFGEVS